MFVEGVKHFKHLLRPYSDAEVEVKVRIGMFYLNGADSVDVDLQLTGDRWFDEVHPKHTLELFSSPRK